MAREKTKHKKMPSTKSADYRSSYSNTIYFQPTVWDLKTSFGQLVRDFEGPNFHAEYHTSISMSWLEAKVAAIYLLINLGNYERENGAVKMPALIRPPFVSEHQADQSIDELVKTLRADFNKYQERMKSEGKSAEDEEE